MLETCQPIAYKKICNSEPFLCKLKATVKENLSDLIQRRLKELDIKKAELARRTKFSRTYITDLANGTGNTQSGQYNLPPDTVFKLAKALEITESEILSAMNYLTDEKHADTYEVLDGVMISFQDDDLTKKQQQEIADIVRKLVVGVKAEKQNQ